MHILNVLAHIQTLRSISNHTILNLCMRVKSNIQIRPNDVFGKVILEHAGYVCGEVLQSIEQIALILNL